MYTFFVVLFMLSTSENCLWMLRKTAVQDSSIIEKSSKGGKPHYFHCAVNMHLQSSIWAFVCWEVICGNHKWGQICFVRPVVEIQMRLQGPDWVLPPWWAFNLDYWKTADSFLLNHAPSPTSFLLLPSCGIVSSNKPDRSQEPGSRGGPRVGSADLRRQVDCSAAMEGGLALNPIIK